MANLVIMSEMVVLKLNKLRVDWNAQQQVCMLYRNDKSPTPSDTAADYQPAIYDGASSQIVRWTNAAQLVAPGVASIRGESLIFQPTGTVLNSNVYGYYVISAREGGRLIYAQRLVDTAPWRIGDTLDPITLIPQWLERAIVD